ncbi:GNAT family N-acetyltransferase [Demequina sp. NBRC 110053]|uniref:GNAT family N-acetyltransferase n=1 Tax=Demequina sp. NBRC 110053 TaxID=1570342 RepID=UPI00135643F6|nr:GNAT family N-acetyltransferase [Demequina sp. NBRC 110053]
MPYAVPQRIETERLVLRPYVATDAEALAAVVPRNMDHLRRYMEWIAFEPQTVEQRRAWIADVNGKWDADTDFTMGIFLQGGEAELVGGTGFHVRTDPDRLEIGYWIDAGHEGRGLVTEAVAALTRVGLELAGADLVDIAHAQTNVRSGAIPSRLGFVREERARAPLFDAGAPVAASRECADDGAMVPAVTWRASRETLSREPLASWPRPLAFDAAGSQIAWPA